MTREEKQTLDEALSYAHIGTLPDVYDDKSGDVWIKAIVKVVKLNGHANYAVAKVDKSGKPVIIKDFGVVARIIRIDELRPYYYLKKKYTVQFKNKDEVLDYVRSQANLTDDELKGMNSEDVIRILNNIYIARQLKVEKQ